MIKTRLVRLVVSVFSTDVGSVLFPALTKDINAGEIQELRPQSKLPN
jgi:peptidoglycan biosynthesis protein MviN/MurJ (putative lipid II flippase)